MSAGRSVCSLCRSFLLKEQPASTSLPARSDERSREILKLLELETPEASEKEEDKHERTRELKADLQRLPRSKYPGQMMVIGTAARETDYVKSIRKLLHSPVLGFDTEAKPQEYKKPCLVQLASRDVCILWRLNSSSQFPTILHGILSSPRFLKVSGRGSSE